MDFKKLKLKADFFNALKGLSKADKLKYVKNCPEEAIETMCEACYNLLKHDKLKNKKSLKKKISPIHKSVKQLGDKKYDIKRKRSLLDDSNVVCGVTSAIGENILPLLNSLLRKTEYSVKKEKKPNNKTKRMRKGKQKNKK